jgi:DNA-directed RNA polymerase specialized sigma24 family protein
MMTPNDLTQWWEDNPDTLKQIARSVARKTRHQMNSPGDLLGATFVAAVDSLRRRHEPRRSIGGWLHAVMFNTAREIIGDEKRARRIVCNTDAVEEAPAPDYDPAGGLLLAERLAWAAARLTPRDLTIVKLTADGWKRAAIAEHLGITPVFVTRRRKELVVGIREGKQARKGKPWFACRPSAVRAVNPSW